MGLFGRGIAFNNMFIPRGPIRFNCYQRQMPMMPRGPIFGGMSINETFTYKTNFWDALTAGLMTFAQTRMMFGGWGAGNVTQVTPQGTAVQQTTTEDKYLKNLTQVLGSKGTFAKHLDKENTYIMTTKDGKVIEGTYQDLIDKFEEDAEPATNGLVKGNNSEQETDTQKQANAAKENNPPLKNRNGKWVDDANNEYEWKNGEFSKVENSDDGNDDRTIKKDNTATETAYVQKNNKSDKNSRTSSKVNTAKSTNSANTKKQVQTVNVKYSIHEHTIGGCTGEAVINFVSSKGPMKIKVSRMGNISSIKGAIRGIENRLEFRSPDELKKALDADLRAKLRELELSEEIIIPAR